MWTIRDIYGHLLEFDTAQITLPLPTVQRITAFEIWSTRKIHPSCYPPLLLAMPSVEELEMIAFLPRRRQVALRPPIRAALGDALNSISLLSVAKFTLDFQEGDPWNEAFEPGLLLESPDAPDTVSMGLARISRLPTLRKMLVVGDLAITPTHFQPVVSSQEQDVPGLRECEFYIGAVTPQGQWLFSRSTNGLGSNEAGEHESEFTDDEMVETPPPFDSEDSDTSDFAPHKAWDRENGEIPYIQFRSTPDWSLFSPLITALTRCVTDYPDLETFTVHIGTVSNITAPVLRMTERTKNTTPICTCHDGIYSSKKNTTWGGRYQRSG
ncbi:hypothetical protein VHEMI04332 [[Torrubiella] hemipterigena]|uniref:F-box domain-containing protein n=1 Tax=[Torrubiella] hemipterigena TaxID=1531966 RepID=A0A0A1TG04_9HYPO|nr:hypothetical protein VHEMI04332 [[Torrubiella] hemipterigena]